MCLGPAWHIVLLWLMGTSLTLFIEVPSEIACSVQGDLAQQGPICTSQGLKEPRPPAQRSPAELPRSGYGRGTSLTQGPVADLAGGGLPHRGLISGPSSTHPSWVYSDGEWGSPLCPWGTPAL